MCHACYGLGCTLSPIIATRMVARGLSWHRYYFVLLGIGVLNAAILVITFHPRFMRNRLDDVPHASPLEIREKSFTAVAFDLPPEKPTNPLLAVVTTRFCWTLALFFILYLGGEISIGGWTVEYMIKVPPTPPTLTPRSAAASHSICPTSRLDSGSVSPSGVSYSPSPRPGTVRSQPY
jgi:fucose permease